MKCPYCITDISSEALVCSTCTRDLYLFKPLLQKLDNLEAAFAAEVQGVIAACEQRVAALEQQVTVLAERALQHDALVVPMAPAVALTSSWSPSLAVTTDAGATVVAAIAAGGGGTPTPAPTPHPYFPTLLTSLCLMLALLIMAHGVLLFIYDLKPLYLRVASMLIPLPIGFFLFARFPQRFVSSMVGVFVAAAAAVAGMMLVTSAIDHVPFAPQTVRDAREVLEYMLSIGLAGLTGLLLARWYYRSSIVTRGSALLQPIGKLFANDGSDASHIEQVVGRLQKIGAMVSPVVAATASVYSGVKAIMGDGT